MAIAHVQTIVVNGSGGTSKTSPTITTTSGNLLIAASGSWQSGVQNNISITDSKSNTWTQVANSPQNPSANTRNQMFYAKNCIGDAAHTFTATTSSAIFFTFFRMEVSGCDTIAPYDTGAGTTGNSTSPSSGATGTRSSNDQIIIGSVGTGDNVNGGTMTAGSGFTIPSGGSQTSFSNYVSAIEYQIVSAAGTDAATFTISSDVWGCIAATFKIAGAAPATSQIGRIFNQSVKRATNY
jgi:hypothetical protein